MIFCTLLNSLFLPQALVLYRSLERATGGKFTLYVLCMDDVTETALRLQRLPSLRTISLAEFETDALREVRRSRSIGEYCFTCTSPLLRHVLGLVEPGQVVTYVDADLAFYSDPNVVLEELGDNDIFIHEHGFSPDFAHLQAASGRFNVGLVSIRNSPVGRACVERWAAQCLDECVMDPAAGKCGDQNYLDEWPSLYPSLVITRNAGVGLAPWNVKRFTIGWGNGTPLVDGEPIVFYHFHSLRPLRPRLGFKPVLAVGPYYKLPEPVFEHLYRPYVRELWSAVGTLVSGGFRVDRQFATLPVIYNANSNEQFLFECLAAPVPRKRNALVIETMYGIDAHRATL